MQIDVFNGDADGICALLQLRLVNPVKSQLVTGVKRDVQLLDNVKVQYGDDITVLDISFQKNQAAVGQLLSRGANIFYVDHHQAGNIPSHHNLKTLIDTSSDTCTSLLVNRYIGDKYLEWAVTGAFGDNLYEPAKRAAFPLLLSENKLQQLELLGICINYNSYGTSLTDLHFSPDLLYQELYSYGSPFDFMDDNVEVYERLLTGYSDDMGKANQLPAEYQTDNVEVYLLPDEAWSRRVSGVFANQLANQSPHKAHAIVSLNAEQAYQISVRSPIDKPTGADQLCSQFSGGGGRKAAAGINHLPIEELNHFIALFEQHYTAI